MEETRSRLVAAALALYRARGYEAVTLRELGAACGLSYATPYRYFTSKDELFSLVRAEVFKSFGEYLKERDPVRAAPLLRLRRVLRAYIEYAQDCPEDYRLIFSMRQPPCAPDSPLGLARRETVDYVISVGQAAIDGGQLKGDASTFVQLVWAGLHGLLSLHVGNQLIHGRSLDDLLDPMLDSIFALMRTGAGVSIHNDSTTTRQAMRVAKHKAPEGRRRSQ